MTNAIGLVYSDLGLNDLHRARMDNEIFGWQFKIQRTITFKFTWMVVLALLAVGTGLTIWYDHSSKERRETIVFGVSLLAATVTIYSLLQAAEGLRRANVEKKAVAATRYVERWNDPGFLPLKEKLFPLFSALESKSEDDVMALLADDAKRLTIITALNFFEEVAVAVNSGSADEQLLCRYFKTLVLKYSATLEEWIRRYRKLRSAPRFFIEFEEMASRWRQSRAD